MGIVKEISERIQILEKTIERQSEQIDKLENKVAFLKKENNSLVKENTSLKKENQSLKKEHENAIFVNPERKRRIEEADRLQTLECIIRMDNEKSIKAVQELLEIWDNSNCGGQINGVRIRFEKVMKFLNKEEVDVIYQYIVNTFSEKKKWTKMYKMIETLLGSELLTKEQVDRLLDLWTLNGGPSVKTFDGFWLQRMFPNVVQKANSSEKWSVYAYGNRFDLRKN